MGSGIIAVLIIAGILLYSLGIDSEASKIAIWAGIIIGIILGGFGILGILISQMKRIF